MCSLFCVPVCLWHMCKCKCARTQLTCKPSCPCGTSEKNPTQTGMICCVQLQTCYLDKLLRKRWNSTTSTRRFVCKRFQHVRNKSTESFKSPLNFVSRCKLLGLIRSNSTETNPWTWMTFSEKKIVLNQCAGPGTILAQSARQQPSKFEMEHDWFLSYIDSCARFGQRG